MIDYVYIGSSPCDEDCAQVGRANYNELMRLETAQFIKAIIQKMGEPPEGVTLKVKDGEVVAAYDDSNEKAADWAWRCESDAPATWAEVDMKAPRLDDPAFTETDLIAVPEKAKPYINPSGKCDLADTRQKSHECATTIKNEFFDASLPGLGGGWANVCPACFGQHRGRLGTGMGQRYKKATDGKFYKVEG